MSEQSESETPTGNAPLIAMLQDALAKAQSGELVEAAIVGLGKTFYQGVVSTQRSIELVGEVELFISLLKDNINGQRMQAQQRQNAVRPRIFHPNEMPFNGGGRRN